MALNRVNMFAKKAVFFTYIILILVLLFASFLLLGFGGPVNLLSEFGKSQNFDLILYGIRIPKLFTAITVGAGLSVAGYIFQSVLRNPLADPYILGVSSGSALGVSIYLFLASGFSYSVLGLHFASIIGSVIASLILIFLLSKMPSRTTLLVLIGVGISYFFSSIVTYLISIMNQSSLYIVSSWLVGNISQASSKELLPPVIFLVLTLGFTVINTPVLQALRMGDSTAITSGVNYKKFNIIFILIASVITALCVSVSGTIGFVGLVVPHVARLIFKISERYLILAVALLGAVFLVLCTAIAGLLSINGEVPVGAITAVIGAPLLVYLIYRQAKN